MAKVDSEFNVNSISRISAGTTIKGEINSPYDIRIDGDFEGKIVSAGRVVIGEKAKISGDIICENFDLWGSVDGNIFVKDTLSLKDGSTLKGAIHVRRFSVELGSIFNGTCQMMSEEDFAKLTEN